MFFNKRIYRQSNNFQQRRNVFNFPKTIFYVSRLPVYLGVGGATAYTYTQLKLEELKSSLFPEWLTVSLNDSLNAVKSVGFFSKLTSLFDDYKPTPTIDIQSIANSHFQTPQPISKSVLPQQSTSNIVQNSTQTPPDHHLMLLTRKLIEVRNLLKAVDVNNTNLKLPSIVVVGSQSSGKSSVLEAIVGHEFLPKGSNMVTRRPIELTLVHSPNINEDYGEFPQLGLGKIKDFAQIQKNLTDLNLAVSDEECVSKDPIELFIFSPNVPDLTLIDLPGYIQIHNRNQPPELKKKISDLCESYIAEPNIILAVCAADVDLANSPALQASRKVDPKGKRTIGVVTKMDLVDPDTGIKILKNREFPLSLGYVGVSCKASPSSGAGSQLSLIRQKNENFDDIYYEKKVDVGTDKLRERLMQVLETHMGKNLVGIMDGVQTELDDSRYHLKVQYNDRKITAESYVAGVLDSLKEKFKQYEKSFGNPEVRRQLKSYLNDQILSICDDIYYSHTDQITQIVRSCSSTDKEFWQQKLDSASASLTKSGLGRGTTQLVVDGLMKKMEELTSQEPFNHHQNATKTIIETSNGLIRSKFHTTVDQVENTIKPYKYDVECTPSEWSDGVKSAIEMVQTKIGVIQTELNEIRGNIGSRKLRKAVGYIEKKEKEQRLIPTTLDIPSSSSSSIEETPQFPSSLIEKTKHYQKLQSQTQILQLRLAALKSRQCRGENRACCPEAYLCMVADKLAYTSVMFINVELLSEFFFSMPRELESKLYYGLRGKDVVDFAKENGMIRDHLESLKRKETLEVVMKKLKELK